MRRTTAALTALCSVALGMAALPTPAANAAAAGSILLGVHTRGESVPLLTAMNAWEGKRNAFADTEQGWHPQSVTVNGTTVKTVSGALDQQTTFAQLTNIWSAGSIPQLTWYPPVGQPGDDAAIAAGTRDEYIATFCNALRNWLSGSDGVYGTTDDRRLFLRFAPEANGNWHQYSPTWHAEGTDPPDATTEKRFAAGYVAMWKHVHGVFLASGLDPTHVAWVFAVAQQDSWYAANGKPVAVMEQLFPGDDATDWVGVDGYNRGGLGMNPGDHWQPAADIFNPMLARLRAVSIKPTAISEVGTTAVQDNGTASDAAKSQWLTDYGNWLAGSGVRMAMYWSDDVSSVAIKPDYPVFGGTTGPDSYTSGGQTYKAYNAYADVVRGSAFTGADTSNPRVVSNAAFLGVDALPG